MTSREAMSGLSARQLVGGAAVAIIAAAWAFGAIAEDVINNDPPLGNLDLRVAGWLHEHATPLLTSLMLAVSNVGSPLAVTVIALAASLVLFWRRSPLRYLMFALPSGELLNVIVKHLVHRHRPTFDDPIQVLTSYSFPSGHALGATVLYLTLASIAIAQTDDRRWRAAALAIATLMIGLIAFSRMYLGVHYLSDVAAGIMEGVVWFGVWLAAVAAAHVRGIRRG